MIDLESGGRSARAQPTKTPDAAAQDDAGQIGGRSGDRSWLHRRRHGHASAAGKHLGSAGTMPPQHSGDFSGAAREYADRRAHGFEQSVAVEQAPWSRLAVIAGLVIGIVGNIAVALTQVVPSNPETAIVLGIILVVLLGAGGLACRGVGELRNSPGWKASGCFLCAAAYLGTATVALVNGVPLIFQS
jgi:hypothetical protein